LRRRAERTWRRRAGKTDDDNQISRLINPCPQPAKRKSADSKAADVVKVLKMFN